MEIGLLKLFHNSAQLVMWTIFRWCGDTDQSSASSCPDRKPSGYLFSLLRVGFLQ